MILQGNSGRYIVFQKAFSYNGMQCTKRFWIQTWVSLEWPFRCCDLVDAKCCATLLVLGQYWFNLQSLFKGHCSIIEIFWVWLTPLLPRRCSRGGGTIEGICQTRAPQLVRVKQWAYLQRRLVAGDIIWPQQSSDQRSPALVNIPTSGHRRWWESNTMLLTIHFYHLL